MMRLLTALVRVFYTRKTRLMKKTFIWKNILLSILILLCAFGLSLIMQEVFSVRDNITAVFIFAVFLISLVTDGYAYGTISAFLSMLAVNWAFTFPYFSFDFIKIENIVSAVVMIVIALFTSMMVIKVRRMEEIKSVSEQERTRANLLRAVSHDLRTPLTTIYGASSMLLENGDALEKNKQTEILKGIKEDSDWLNRIVENLLSITKINDGKVKIIKTPTVLDELVDSVVARFKKRYPTVNLQISIPDDIVVIPMDALLISQVIVNVLENAVYHAKGMTILHFSVEVKHGVAIFNVKDDGVGIEKERLANLFEGYRGDKDNAYDNRKRNAGIGLSVCATIIKAHGGKIWAENLRDGGALVTFTLEAEINKNE